MRVKLVREYKGFGLMRVDLKNYTSIDAFAIIDRAGKAHHVRGDFPSVRGRSSVEIHGLTHEAKDPYDLLTVVGDAMTDELPGIRYVIEQLRDFLAIGGPTARKNAPGLRRVLDAITDLEGELS